MEQVSAENYELGVVSIRLNGDRLQAANMGLSFDIYMVFFWLALSNSRP